jgi:hypothetical protein
LATPGRVGDALRIQYLKRDHAVGYADGLAVSIVDRLCDVYVLLAFVAIGVVHLAHAIAAPLSQATWIAVVVVAIAPGFLFVRSIAEPAAQWMYRRFSDGDVHEGLRAFFAALRRQVGLTLGGPIVITVVLCRQHVRFGSLLCVQAILRSSTSRRSWRSARLESLPISISVSGSANVLRAGLPAFGLAETLGIAFGLGIFAVIYVPTLLVGFFAWLVWPPSE